MSETVLIIGESGSGKSTSLRNLNHEETFIINVLNKPLPFRGYAAKYKPLATDGLTGNYYATDDFIKLRRAISLVNTKRLDIKTLVIDDFQYIMCNELMRRSAEKGWDKFSDIAYHAWQIVQDLTVSRPDLDCFVLSHSVTREDGKIAPKTIGNMLDKHITLEGMFTVVLQALVMDGKYRFLTQSTGNYISKSPMGMFEDMYIDNDLSNVKTIMYNYSNEDIAQ